jgi:hypothetical protein
LLRSAIKNDLQRGNAESIWNFFRLVRYDSKEGTETTDFPRKNLHAHRDKFPYPSGKICMGMEKKLHEGENLLAYPSAYTYDRQEIQFMIYTKK